VAFFDICSNEEVEVPDTIMKRMLLSLLQLLVLLSVVTLYRGTVRRTEGRTVIQERWMMAARLQTAN
jgi:hypothetical protein